jgi:hypothetical protein
MAERTKRETIRLLKDEDCYKCAHRREIPGNAHSRCNNHTAIVEGDERGIKGGWFIWPLNFDPVWLKSCNGFSDKPEDRNAPTKELDPLLELSALLDRHFRVM